MIEVASIRYGCQWGSDGHVKGWPMRIDFGSVGPEVTVDEMLEGRGHAVLLIDQLVTLVRGMTGLDTPIELVQPAPAGLATKLVEAGFYVALC
ncbi:MAG: hypothetical protein EBR33_09225 [Synechococcaceae bacterium WB4_1_0192]|nr:hypothetical protein [Synechococcaceae bacterium WB4_1_0192]